MKRRTFLKALLAGPSIAPVMASAIAAASTSAALSPRQVATFVPVTDSLMRGRRLIESMNVPSNTMYVVPSLRGE